MGPSYYYYCTKELSASFFFLSTLGPMHRFEKKMDDAQTQKLGCVMQTLGV